MKKFKDSINFDDIRFFVGIYGERILVYIHKYICQMNPEVFGLVVMLILLLLNSYVNKK